MAPTYLNKPRLPRLHQMSLRHARHLVAVPDGVQLRLHRRRRSRTHEVRIAGDDDLREGLTERVERPWWVLARARWRARGALLRAFASAYLALVVRVATEPGRTAFRAWRVAASRRASARARMLLADREAALAQRYRQRAALAAWAAASREVAVRGAAAGPFGALDMARRSAQRVAHLAWLRGYMSR